MSYIEDVLKKRSTESENILYKQWLVAKEYVPQVLNTVSQIFPHYSLHDSSHSESILTNIERVLGRRFIDSLSVSDLWLLLSAAYYHDCGMAVFSKDTTEALKNPKFIELVRTFQSDKDSSLHKYAEYYDCKGDKLEYKKVEVTGESYESLTFLLADFIRRQHADRSDMFVKGDISINLPGNPIPNRLITSLGEICLSHAKDFQYVMAMPYKANGVVDGDFCHPRFVACMLRLGDLLDLDNNRFSDVLLKTLSDMPKDSWEHYYKHLATSHYLVSNRRIEITAKCEDIDVAEKAEQWFGWIIQEMHNLQAHWSDIMPSEGVPTTLPSLGDIKVEIEGYEPIDGKNITRFEMDTGRAMELLQGTDIYQGKTEFMRELLQNATDAIYIRMFKEHEDANDIPTDDADGLRQFIKECQNRKIAVRIEKIDTASVSKDSDGEEANRYAITITDDGVGISMETLKYMINTGSGSQNAEKKALVERMPKFMRPSGCFGIGFQSVFMVTGKVTIHSRNLDSGQAIDIEMYDPKGPRKGGVYVKLNPTNKSFGTTITFEVESKIIENRYKDNDFIGEKQPVREEIDGIKWQVEAFRGNSWIPISLNWEAKKEQQENQKFLWYSSETGLQIVAFDVKDEWGSNMYLGNSYACFRNQSWNRIGIPFIGVEVNLLDGQASQYLKLDRESLKDDAEDEIKQKILNTLYEYFTTQEQSEGFPRDIASMYYHTFGQCRRQPKPSYADAWREYKLEHERTVKTLGAWYDELADKEVIVNRDRGNVPDSILKGGVAIWDGRTYFAEQFLMLRLYQDCFQSIEYYSVDGGHTFDGFVLFKGESPIAGRFDVRRLLSCCDEDRFFMPCRQDSPLRVILLHEDKKKGIVGEDDGRLCFSSGSLQMPSYMVSPYLGKGVYYWDETKEEALYDWVYEHRFDANVTKEQIKEAYTAFRKKWSKLLDFRPYHEDKLKYEE